jgi:hypothetical protein
MSLLLEYSAIPDVFDASSFSSDETAFLYMQNLKDVMMNDAVVRDLRNGEWKDLFSRNGRVWHKRGVELIKKIVSQNRIRKFPCALDKVPVSDMDWCNEALETHKKEPLTGIIAGKNTAEIFIANDLVASFDKLHKKTWWKKDSSIRLDRKEADYMANLKFILLCSNSLMFIDPHIDPRELRYQPFFKIVSVMSNRIEKPLVEIHRCSYVGSGSGRSFPDWEKIFEDNL